jgi:uncharacterized membrane protein YbhN (UPF0104 family)
MKGQGAGILMVAITAIFSAVAVVILGNISTTGWSSINVTVWTYIPTFILLGVLAYAAFSYRFK